MIKSEEFGLYSRSQLAFIPEISKAVNQGDTLEIDLGKGVVQNTTSGEPFSFTPYDAFIMDMIREGGIINYAYKKHLETRWPEGKE